jgi:hypothetical protein
VGCLLFFPLLLEQIITKGNRQVPESSESLMVLLKKAAKSPLGFSKRTISIIGDVFFFEINPRRNRYGKM